MIIMDTTLDNLHIKPHSKREVPQHQFCTKFCTILRLVAEI